MWWLCLREAGALTENDTAAFVLEIFGKAYLGVTRRLQMVYMLEPAGSHGVWGLDDFHCLPFLWGAAQLCEDLSEQRTGVRLLTRTLTRSLSRSRSLSLSRRLSLTRIPALKSEPEPAPAPAP